jgi:predicted lactoylglutathione lyase
MSQQICVNLPVTDLERPKAFLGAVPCAPQDHGFMYGHGFEDLDGHVREPGYMETPPA